MDNEELRTALKDPTQRAQAAFNIWNSGEPNPELVEPLIQALEDNPGDDFGILLYALGKLHDPRAFEPIVKHLKSGISYRRGVAADVLGELGDKRAITPLTKLLKDKAIAWTYEHHNYPMKVAEVARMALQQLQKIRTPPNTCH
jgi:HEAT repeat protein